MKIEKYCCDICGREISRSEGITGFKGCYREIRIISDWNVLKAFEYADICSSCQEAFANFLSKRAFAFEKENENG